jgi:phosphoglycolate phosphatase-like HAD superfamily hydrolase
VSAGLPVAIDLDALGDTRRLWNDWVESAGAMLGIDPGSLSGDRGEAAAALDRAGAGNWRALLERFCEDRAPAYLRRDAVASAALRGLAGEGRTLGVFTDAPEPLAHVALAQLGAGRRVTAVETGSGALERLLSELGDGALVVRTLDELRAAAEGR